MEAVISGRAGVALVVDGDSLMSLDVEDLNKFVERTPADLRFLIGEAADCVSLENTTRRQVAETLELEYNASCALDMALIALDPETSGDLRDEAIEVLEGLLGDERIVERLESILYAKPLPDEADLTAVRETCKVKGRRVAKTVFERLAQSQPAMQTVREIWEAIPEAASEKKKGGT